MFPRCRHARPANTIAQHSEGLGRLPCRRRVRMSRLRHARRDVAGLRVPPAEMTQVPDSESASPADALRDTSLRPARSRIVLAVATVAFSHLGALAKH